MLKTQLPGLFFKPVQVHRQLANLLMQLADQLLLVLRAGLPGLEQFGHERWTPKIRPRVKFDFRRFAVDKKEQTYESKTETTQCGLQGQSGIRSPGGAQNGRATGARVRGASGASHAVAGDDSGSHARTVRARAARHGGPGAVDRPTASEDWPADGGPGLA